MLRTSFLIGLFLIILINFINAQDIKSIYPDLEKLCKELHAYPELSLQEEKTAERIAAELRNIGFEVTEHFAGNGLVGVLKNGPGKIILIRTDLDALPIEENTSLPFSSKNKGIMHACGHDIHMSVFIGTARLLAENKNKWKGTLLMIGQPAEEVGNGAKMMLDAGLYEKFGVPDYALAIHVAPGIAAGSVTFSPGYAMASASSVTIKVKGLGGHGAMPQNAIDPIVLSAQMILTFQTIVSREISPFDPAVVTVGYIKGGTKHNIIPSEVEMGLTIRSFNDEVHKKIIASIKNKIHYIAKSGGLPDNLLPEINIPDETPSVYNNPDLTNKIIPLLKKEFGNDKVVQSQPWSASEDFAHYGRTVDKVPSLLLWVGLESKETMARILKGEKTPILHSPNIIPDYENTIKTGVRTITSAAFNLLSK